MTALRRSLHAARALAKEAEVAFALHALGRLWYLGGKLRRAEAVTELALSWYERSRDARGSALALSLLGHLAWARGDGQRALTFYRRALDVSGPASGPSMRAYLRCNLGVVELGIGMVAAARECFRAGLDDAREAGDPALVSHLCTSLAEVCLEERDFEGADALLEESMRTYRRMGHYAAGVVATATRLARVANHRGDHARAREWAQVGIDQARQEWGSNEEALECLVQAAWADARLGFPVAARETLAHAIRLARQRCEFAELARAIVVGAILAYERSTPDRAYEAVASIHADPPDASIRRWAEEILTRWRADMGPERASALEERARGLDWRTLESGDMEVCA